MYNLSAQEIRELFVSKKLNAFEIAEYFLHRIKAHDSKISALISTLDERAITKAKQLDEKRKSGASLGKMAGVPVIIKDNMHIKGEITTCGSKFLTHYHAPFSATAVELLEQEDAIILGKANLDEFAMGSSTEHSAFMKTKNPWNLECTPGGSSGGSAAAVAARYAPFALGSDTGGSIRQPAAFSGIVGFKPTYGRVSRYGLVAFGSSLDQIGPFANSVADAAMIMEVLGAYSENDSTSINSPQEEYLKQIEKPISALTIGVPRNLIDSLSPELSKLFENALDQYKQMGVKLVDIELKTMKYSIPLYYILATAEASTNLARFDGVLFSNRSKAATNLKELYELSKEEGFGHEVKQRIMLGTFVLSSGHQDQYYKRAQKVRRLLINEFNKVYEQCDVIALPTTPSTAFKIGDITDPLTMYLQDIYTIFANMGGLPAVSLPIGFDSKNLPFGLQLAGPQMADGKVLCFAHHLEKSMGSPFNHKCPPLFDEDTTP